MPKYRLTFNKWASTYDENVSKASATDDWMFGGYDRVLDKVVENCELEKNGYSTVLEIGIGTGNLAARFLQKGLRVYGIDPSREMRKACRSKYPGIKVMPGDFLSYPRSLKSVGCIVSAYAFHHLEGVEKVKAIPMMKKLLKPGGRIVIADFMYQNGAAIETTNRSIRDKYGGDMAEAFSGEYPAFYDNLKSALEKEGFKADGEQLTVSVWIIRARL